MEYKIGDRVIILKPEQKYLNDGSIIEYGIYAFLETMRPYIGQSGTIVNIGKEDPKSVYGCDSSYAPLGYYRVELTRLNGTPEFFTAYGQSRNTICYWFLEKHIVKATPCNDLNKCLSL